jgi:hypothetical protein
VITAEIASWKSACRMRSRPGCRGEMRSMSGVTGFRTSARRVDGNASGLEESETMEEHDGRARYGRRDR